MENQQAAKRIRRAVDRKSEKKRKRIRKAVMKKQRLAKRRREGDRISQLPLHILQNHILSLLPQNDAVRTCVLSKSWRHLGPTLPKFEFSERCFREKSQQFLRVLENTLQRYVDQNLSIQEFNLGMLWLPKPDSESVSFLKKWIPKVITKIGGVKTFNLSALDFTLPPVLFQAESLTELYLEGCKLDQTSIINNCINVKLQLLKRISLNLVSIEDETFEKIMSICPLIEHLVLKKCYGLRTIKVNKAPNLKHFDCQIVTSEKDNVGCIGSIEMNDTPYLDTIHVSECSSGWNHMHDWWYHLQHDNYFFPRLKSLHLWRVRVPSVLFINLSSNSCPCLEEFQLRDCSGFREFKLSNRSIKRLIFETPEEHPVEVFAIDAANMLHFELRTDYLPSIFSFATTTSRGEWESHIHLGGYKDINAWYFKLYEFLKALSQSQISLHISHLPKSTNSYGGVCEPLVVDHLCLSSYHTLEISFNSLFHICRPMYIGLSLVHTYSNKRYERELLESIWETLVQKKGGCDFWQQDLEESSIQVSDENTNEWRVVQDIPKPKNQSIRFRLKWRDLSKLA